MRFSGNPSIRQGLLTAEMAILGRRSEVAMDGSTAISRAAIVSLGFSATGLPTAA